MELIDHKMTTGEPENEIRVNGTIIREEDIAKEMQYHPADTREGAHHLAAQSLVIRELLLAEADRLGIDEQSAPPEAGETPEQARTRVLMDREIVTPEPDERACRTFFDNNPDRFKTSPLYEPRHILLAASPDVLEDRQKAALLANELLEELKEHPGHFSALVRQHSACSSKEVEGNLGQISKGQTTPEFETQLFKLGEGLADQPIESRYGFHVVIVDRCIEGRPLPYDQVADRIEGYLKSRVRHTATHQYLQQLVGKAEIVGVEIEGAGSPLMQ